MAVLVLVVAAAILLGAASGPSVRVEVADLERGVPRALSVAWGGDTVLGSSYGLPGRHGRSLLAPVRADLRRADLALLNYEGTFAKGGTPKCPPVTNGTGFAFQAPPRNARALRWAGVDAVNLANNHSLDAGIEGLVETQAALRRAKVASTGQPGVIRFITRRGTRIALVGFAPYPWANDLADLDAADALVRTADARADLVIVMAHIGAEGGDDVTRTPRGPESSFGEFRGDARAFARRVVDAGADLVLGSGPHVLRGVERYKGRTIAYSLGNLAGLDTFSTRGAASLSGVLEVRVGRTGVSRAVRLRSLRLTDRGEARRDPSAASRALVRRLSRRDFGQRAARVR